MWNRGKQHRQGRVLLRRRGTKGVRTERAGVTRGGEAGGGPSPEKDGWGLEATKVVRWCFCFWVIVKGWVRGMGRLGQRFKEPGAEGGRKREAPGHSRERAVPLAVPPCLWLGSGLHPVETPAQVCGQC